MRGLSEQRRRSMKKHKKILISVGAVLGALLLAFGVYIYIRTAKFRVSGELQSVEVSYKHALSGQLNPLTTSDPEQIEVLRKCLKKALQNNLHADIQILTAPHDYQITFTYKNGETETRDYTAYPTGSQKYDNPFRDFYVLFDETETAEAS